jgi:hypothetical protein
VRGGEVHIGQHVVLGLVHGLGQLWMAAARSIGDIAPGGVRFLRVGRGEGLAPWGSDEVQKLHQLAKKGMSLKAIAKALTRSEESVKTRAKADGLDIARLR